MKRSDETIVSLDRIRNNELDDSDRKAIAEELKMYRARFKDHETVVHEGVRGSVDTYAPYQAVVSFNRTSSSGSRLFESTLDHHHTIRLDVSCARVVECDGHVSVMDECEIVTLSMSEMQFATLLTSMNHGCGTPATIDRLMGYMIDSPETPVESDSELHKKKVKAFAKKSLEHLESLKGSIEAWIREKHRPTMKELERMVFDFNVATNNIPANFTHIETLLEDRMSERITQAKAEVAAHVNTVVANMGLSSLKELKLLNRGSNGGDS